MPYNTNNSRALSEFEKTSRAIWGEMQGISQENNQEYTDEFYGTNPSEKVNVEKLVRYIEDCQNFNTNSFNWVDYIGSTEIPLKTTINPLVAKYFPSNEIKVYQNVHWEYTDYKGETKKSSFNVKLNKRKNDFIDAKKTGVQIKLNKSDQKLYYILEFYFENTNDNRKYNPNDDFTIAEKYIAIQFKTNELKDFFYLWENLFKNTSRLAEILSNYILKIENDESLSLFYSQLSQEVIEVLQQLNINKETLLNHLLRLKKYDENSVFKDSSLAIINLLSIVKDTKYIYQWFVQHEDILLQLYSNMDGVSKFLGQEVSNKILFAELCSGIAQNEKFNAYEGLERKTFRIDEQHKIASKPFESKDNGTFFLQQMEQVNKTIDELSFDENLIPVKTGKKEDVTYMEPTNSGFDFWPLEPVNLEILENGELISIPVAALFVKALADEQIKNDIYKAIRLGISVAFFIAGIYTLGTASGGLMTALALADVTLSAADIAVLVFEDQLTEEFLNTYNRIMLGVGIAAAPFLLAGFFKKGLQLLKTASQSSKEFIRICIFKVLLEKNIINFEANTVKILTQNTEVVLATKAVLDAPKVARLHKLDCFLVSGNVTVNKNTVEEFALIYKGEAIAKGTKADFQNQIKEIGKNIHNENRLVETLESMLKGSLRRVLVIGKYSKRTFDINNCGGPILNLSWKNARITKEGIEIVKKHLSRFELDDWNVRMIDRLEKIEKREISITDFDKRFYTHEIRESERYKALGHETTTWKDLQEEVFGELWDNTHAATLEDYKVYEKIEYQGKNVYSLYHPEVQF